MTGSDHVIISDDGKYRYRLTRIWNLEGPNIHFVMLNPSTADAQNDDPTVRRCVAFANDWAFGRLTVSNLFAYRTSYPRRLKTCADPIGPENRAYLRGVALSREPIVCAWGVGAVQIDQDWTNEIASDLRATGRALVLGLTKYGHPRHPLYLPGSARAMDWRHLIDCGSSA